MNNNMTTDNMSNEEVIEVLKGIVFGGFDRTTRKERQALALAIKALEARPQGKWIFKNGKYRCTACGEKAIYCFNGSLAITQTELLTHFCPNCGADMRGGAE